MAKTRQTRIHWENFRTLTKFSGIVNNPAHILLICTFSHVKMSHITEKDMSVLVLRDMFKSFAHIFLKIKSHPDKEFQRQIHVYMPHGQ